MISLINVYGMEQQIADIERIRRILGKEKIIICGHSFGGFTATMYAVEFPERVKKLILVSPADIIKMPQTDGGLYQRIMDYLKDEETKKKYENYLKVFFDYKSVFNNTEDDLVDINHRFVEFYACALRSAGFDTTVVVVPKEYIGGWLIPGIFFTIEQKHDYRSALKRITCPVLIIHAENDIALNIEGINTYKESIENCTLNIIEKAGHFSYDEKPEDFAEVVRAFLAK